MLFGSRCLTQTLTENMKRSTVIKTFQLVFSTFPNIPAADSARIAAEFQELQNVSKVTPDPRRRILEILHATRALDSTMDEIFTAIGEPIPTKEKALGKYLNKLNSHTVVGPNKFATRLDEPSKLRYKTFVADVRNQMMHRAGEYPVSEKALEGFLAVVNEWLGHVCALK
jgi:hypothetical protein